MSIWLQAVLALAVCWLLAAIVARLTDPLRLFYGLAVAGFLLLPMALVLDAWGVRAARWAALLLFASLFVGGAAFVVIGHQATRRRQDSG